MPRLIRKRSAAATARFEGPTPAPARFPDPAPARSLFPAPALPPASNDFTESIFNYTLFF